MKDSRPLSTTFREPVAFRHSSGGEVVMPSHSPREGGWLALCLVTCTSFACMSIYVYLCLCSTFYLSTYLVYLCLRQPIAQSCALIVMALATSLTMVGRPVGAGSSGLWVHAHVDVVVRSIEGKPQLVWVRCGPGHLLHPAQRASG